MPRAKPAYDRDGGWKYRQYTPEEWEDLGRRAREQLRQFYPDKTAVADEFFGHPADSWANHLLSTAAEALGMVRWLRLRRSNEELRAEQADLLKVLTTAAEKLGTISHDLDMLLGADADALATRDAIKNLIPNVEASLAKIAELPRAATVAEAQSDAAKEMAVRCLRVFHDAGGKVAATADKDLGYISEAVALMKVLGDLVGLCLDESSWKRVVISAKQSAPELQ